jgi:transcriptional regulator with XRE-family HTH domain
MNELQNLAKQTFLASLGKRFRDERLKKGLTIEQLANKCDFPYSQISRLELGKINPTAYTLKTILQHLNTDEQLFDNTLFDLLSNDGACD